MLEAEASEDKSLNVYLSELLDRVLLYSDCMLPSSDDAFLNDLCSLYPCETHIDQDSKILTKSFLVSRILFEVYGKVPVGSLQTWSVTLLDDLWVETESHFARISQCRERDLHRGQRIIPDYDVVHGLAAVDSTPSYARSDPIILATTRRVQDIKKSIDFLKEVLAGDI